MLFSAENQQVRIALRTGRWSIGKKVNEHDGAEYVKVKKGSCVSICDVLRSPCTCAVSRKTLERLAENRHCRLADQVPEIKDREMEKKRNGEEREKEKKQKKEKMDVRGGNEEEEEEEKKISGKRRKSGKDWRQRKGKKKIVKSRKRKRIRRRRAGEA